MFARPGEDDAAAMGLEEVKKKCNDVSDDEWNDAMDVDDREIKWFVFLSFRYVFENGFAFSSLHCGSIGCFFSIFFPFFLIANLAKQ